MATITAARVLQQVDTLLPNQYTTAEKLRWLTQAEGFVRREILGERGELPALQETAELCVCSPYEELYRHYVEAQIHYCNGEMARYNNAVTAWNNAFLTYRDYHTRTHLPAAAAAALRLR